MDLSIQQLRMLSEVARRGTIASAADHLGYTPSAVSQQLSSAEKSTGVAMLERVGRNVFLTDAGRALVSHADIVLNQLEQAQAAIEQVQGEVAGVLRLGFIESVGSTMLSPIMTRLQCDYPDLKLRTRGIDGAWPEELLRSGDLDIAFVVGYDGEPALVQQGFGRVKLFRDWFSLVVPASRYPGRQPKTVSLASFADEDFISPPPDDACGLAVFEAMAAANVSPDSAHRISDYPTTLRLIAAEAGVSLVPDLGLRSVPDGVRVLTLDEPRFRTIGLMYRESSEQRPAMQALIGVISDVVDELDLDRG